MASDKNKYHHGDVPQALMEAALVRIKKDGVEKLSLRALARDIGVSQTAPYRHFKDKTQLLVKLACDGFHELANKTDQASQGLPCTDAIMATGKAYVSFAQEHPEQYKLMFGSKIESCGTHPELVEASQRSFAVLINHVNKGMDDGTLAQVDPILLAASCWAKVHGIASLLIDGFYENKLPCSFESFLEQQLDFNTYGIAKK